MTLDKEAQAFLDQRAALGARPFHELSVPQAREQAIRMSRLLGPGESVARVQDRTIPVPGGEIPIRIYWAATDAILPLLVYFHGGGWVHGNLETADAWCRAFTNASQCIVVSVNYRHAPEHRFPTPVEDAYEATCWASENGAALNGDAARLAVGGASAGGNLAAAVTLMARDRGKPMIAYQLLLVPVTNYSFDTRSYRDNAEGYGLMTKDMVKYWELYLATESDGQNLYASPLKAKTLENLPRAHVLTTEFDPLHDDGKEYAERLREARVSVVYQCYQGMVHAFQGPQAFQDAAREFRQALGRIS